MKHLAQRGTEQWPLLDFYWSSPIEVNICELSNIQFAFITFVPNMCDLKQFLYFSLCPIIFNWKIHRFTSSWPFANYLWNSGTNYGSWYCSTSLTYILEWIYYIDLNYFHCLPSLFLCNEKLHKRTTAIWNLISFKLKVYKIKKL